MKQIPAFPHWFGVIPLLLLALAFSIPKLADHLFWWDEVVTIDMVSGQHGTPFTVDPGWPPLYNLGLAAWGRGFGWTEAATRFLSTLLGVLTIAVMYRLGSVVANRRIGLLAALLLASSAFYLHYMREMRGYTLYTLFTALSVWAYWLVLRDQRGRRGRELLFVLSVAGLLYSHYIASTTAIAIGLYHLLFVPKNRRWWRIVGLIMLSGGLFLFWIFGFFEALAGESMRDRSIPPLTNLNMIAYGFSNSLAVLLVMLVLHTVLRVRGRAAGFAGFWALTVLILTFIFDFTLHYLFHIRHIIGFLVPLLLVLALAIDDLGRLFRPLRVMLAGLWVVVGVGNSLTPDFMNRLQNQVQLIPRVYLETVQTAQTCMQPDDAAVFYAAPPFWEWQFYPVFNHYLGDTHLRYTQLTQMRLSPEKPPSDEPYSTRVLDFIGAAPRVWRFDLTSLPAVPEALDFEQTLSSAEYRLCEPIASANGVDTRVYVREGAVCPAAVQTPC